MRRATFCLVCAMIALSYAASVGAVVAPGLDIDTLTADSTLIVVGQVTSVQNLGRTIIQAGIISSPANAMLATLRVDRVLKGQVTGPTPPAFHFAVPDEMVGWGWVTSSSYGIFFLVDDHGELKLTSPYHPSLVATPEATIQEGTSIERVIGELGAVLESSTPSIQQKREAVYELSRSTDPAVVAVLRPFASINDMTLRLPVNAVLLEHGDLSTLQFAQDSLLNPDPKIAQAAADNFTYAIFMDVKDERAIPALTKLLGVSNIGVRRAAASALMHTGSNSAIKPLLSVLDDSDFQVRFYGIEGLAQITGQTEWGTYMGEFKSNEAKYLNHWKDWAEANVQ